MFDFGHMTDLGTLRREYKRLALKHHPDMPGGSEAAMKALNNAYDAAVERITAAAARCRDTTTATDSSTADSSTANSSTADTAQAAREYREVLSRLIHLRGLEIELCGRWLWIGGNTYPHREALKAAGC